MVKKIRVIDEAPAVEEKTPDNDIMELAKTMDWKLWEIYKTAKRVEKYLEIEDIDVAKK